MSIIHTHFYYESFPIAIVVAQLSIKIIQFRISTTTAVAETQSQQQGASGQFQPIQIYISDQQVHFFKLKWQKFLGLEF